MFGQVGATMVRVWNKGLTRPVAGGIRLGSGSGPPGTVPEKVLVRIAGLSLAFAASQPTGVSLSPLALLGSKLQPRRCLVALPMGPGALRGEGGSAGYYHLESCSIRLALH